MSFTKIEAIVKRYRESGRMAHIHPRKKTVTVDGRPALPFKIAAELMLKNLSA